MERIHGGDWAAYELEYGKMPLDFSASLSPLGMPGRVYQAAVDAMRGAGRYPDPSCRRLRAALSERHGVDRAQIVCGAGAADLIDRLARVLQPKRALIPAPTFSEYERALLSVGCEVERFPLPGDFHLQEEFVGAITPETDAVFLCNPNNPTGLLTEPALLRRCLERGGTLIVDECFLDLTDDPARYSLVSFLRDYPNLILLRAFTKTFAMAGLRLGYALCGSAETARALRDVGQPWPVSVPAEAAGIAALKEPDYENEVRAFLHTERARMLQTLSGMGLRVVPGQANFLLFYSEDTDLAQKLRTKGILLRDCRDFPGLCPGWYRTAIRKREENDMLLKALGEA